MIITTKFFHPRGSEGAGASCADAHTRLANQCFRACASLNAANAISSLFTTGEKPRYDVYMQTCVLYTGAIFVKEAICITEFRPKMYHTYFDRQNQQKSHGFVFNTKLYSTNRGSQKSMGHKVATVPLILHGRSFKALISLTVQLQGSLLMS